MFVGNDGEKAGAAEFMGIATIIVKLFTFFPASMNIIDN
jgi:hypothetical protein